MAKFLLGQRDANRRYRGNQDARAKLYREPLEAEPSDICCAATTRLFLSAASRGVVGDGGVVEGVAAAVAAALSVVDETGVGGSAGVTGAPRRATSSLVPPATADGFSL